MQRPIWLLSMDSDEFRAPPTTTAALSAYYQKYGARASTTDISLIHFESGKDIDAWFTQWLIEATTACKAAEEAGLQPILGFSFYTWNAAEFLSIAKRAKHHLPQLQIIAGGPHVQQAEDYLGSEAIDVIFLGEAEVTFQEFLDCDDSTAWPSIDGLAFLKNNEIQRTADRARCKTLDDFPSPLNVLELTDAEGNPLYEAIAYETSRGCPFTCAFCEWGTGAIGSKMYQWSLERIREDWETIVNAGIKDIWLADSNFGALKQDLPKTKILIELKDKTGLPVSFATSWSKKHSRQVQEIALLLHSKGLLPHYQLALQTLTPEALRLSNRQNMSSNEYKPIAKTMSEQGVPIAAELIWGLPGDTLAEFEHNLDELLASFPNINIFGYTLLPGTEFYRKREEYKIKTIPVAGYGKAKGEYVVGCHTFNTDEGKEGYFLITAHILLVHGHIMPLTTRLLALQGKIAVSPLFRKILRALIQCLALDIDTLDTDSRMSIYEHRDAIYLQAIAQSDICFDVIKRILLEAYSSIDEDPQPVLNVLELDSLLCPREGAEQAISSITDFDASSWETSLSAMEIPNDLLDINHSGDSNTQTCHWELTVQHPGGVGDILVVADGGSWLRGVITASRRTTGRADYIARL